MKKLALLVAIASTTTSVMAQQNPIAGLVGAVQSLGRVLGGGSQQQTTGGPQQVTNLDAILNTYEQDAAGSGVNVYTACNSVVTQTVDNETKGALAKMRLGDYAMASAGLRLNAEWIAAQAVGPKPCRSTADVYTQVGQLLALSALAAKNSGLLNERTSTDARNALLLMQSDAASNKQLIDQLVSAGLAGSSTASLNAPTISMSASDAVARYKQNTFGFNTKYSGKVLRVNGKIQNIAGSGNTAVVALVGYMPKNIDDQGFQDVVRCSIADPDSLSAAADLAKGHAATLSGVYRPDSQAMNIGIELQNCKVVQ